jgi:hypothetical protein
MKGGKAERRDKLMDQGVGHQGSIASFTTTPQSRPDALESGRVRA